MQNLFQSVGLNVNNPHFLIMQGRITKVLNMKPKETLGLIEEAAGTRMFEVKKDAAVKTIEKKHEKVDQINKVLEEEITPTLRKLQRERTEYLQWAASNTESERLSRLVIAWDYTQAESLKNGSAEAIGKLNTELQAAVQGAAGHRAAAEEKEHEVAAQERKLADAKAGSHASLSRAVDEVGRDVNKAEAVHKTCAGQLGEESKARDVAVKAARDGEAQRASLATTQQKARADASVAQGEASALKSTVESLEQKLTAVRAGMTGVGSGTVEEQLRTGKGKVSSLNTDIHNFTSVVKTRRNQAKDLGASIKESEKEYASFQKKVDENARGVEAARSTMKATGFDATQDEQLRSAKSTAEAEVAASQEAYEAAASSISSYLTFSYDRKGMGGTWDERRVKGPVASLLTIKRPEAAQALQVIAGGKLTNVVVDTDETGKQLLERGKLVRRVTLIPLNTIKGRTPTPAQVSQVAQSTGGKAYLASSAVGVVDPMYAKVLDFLFGTAFICADDETAKAVAYGPAKCTAVTLAGDVFDPAGTLEGGSSLDVAGQKPLLIRVAEMRSFGEALAKAKAQVSDLEAQIAALAGQAKLYAKAQLALELAEHELNMAQQRMNGTRVGQDKLRLASVSAEVESTERSLEEAKTALAEWQGKVKELEAEMKNAASAQQARTAAVEKELAGARKAMEGAQERARKLNNTADGAQFELDNATKATAAEAKAIEERTGAVESIAKQLEGFAEALAAAKGRQAEAKARLAEAQAAIAAADKARQRLMKEKERDLESADAAERDAKKLEGDVKKTTAAALDADRKLADLMDKYHWIATERASFGMAHSDYDFKRNDPRAAEATLKKIASEQAKREKSINKKVMGMIETAEREYAELNRKRLIIENDKVKIEVRSP